MKRVGKLSPAFAVATIALAGAAVAAEQPRTKQDKAPQGSAGMRVERDPATGQLKAATTPLSAAEQAAFSADPARVERIDLANGARLYRLNGQGTEAMIAHRRADGTLEMQCTDQVEALRQGAPGGADER